MKIGIFGTGVVARTLGGTLLERRFDVMFGTRDPEKTMTRQDKDGMGNDPFPVWKKAHAAAKLGSFSEAAAHGEVLMNATSGASSLSALLMAGDENLSGKILIDVANPLDFSKGFPPFLSVANTDSLAEQIQRAHPGARVVKTLNTVTAALMVRPALVPGDHSLFVSGNDAEAKASVISYLHDWYGWKKENIIDVGDITTARGTEMLLPVWVRLYGAFQSPMFNFHIVRAT